MDTNPGATFTARLNDLQYILPLHQDPEVVQAYLDGVDQKWKLFGGALAPLRSTVIADRGLVRRYETIPPDNATAMGVVDSDTPLAQPFTQSSWTNLRLQPSLIQDVEVAVQYDERTDWEIQQVYGKSLADVAKFLMGQAATQMYRLLTPHMVADRRGILGTVKQAVSGTTTDDSTNSQYVFDLKIGANGIMSAFGKGAILQVCAVPGAFGNAITTLRNYTRFLKVIDYIKDPVYAAADGSCFTVKVAAPYTDAADKVAVKAQIDAIIVSDVVVRWAGATAGATSLPRGGPNYGFAGFRHWSETNNAGAFANIEQCGGATTTALVTDENSPRTVSRNATSKEWDAILNMLVIEGGGNNVGSATAMGYIDSAFANLRMRNGSKVNRVALVSHQVHKALRQFIGVSSIARWENVDDTTRKVMQRWGTTGFVYQGESAEPIIFAQSDAVPSDQIALMEDGAFEMLVGAKTGTPRWLPGEIGGVWSRRRNASGQELHSFVARMHMAAQMFPTRCLGDSIAVIRNLVPTA